MPQSISDNKKSRGRPVTTGTNPLIGVRLPPALLGALDRFIAEEHPDITRPDALRRAFSEWAKAKGLLD